MDKVITLITTLTNKLENDWKPQLEAINIYDDVAVLYENYDNYIANIMLAFIVFAYHKESPYLDLHKDRLDNKKGILQSLAGDAALDHEDLKKAISDEQAIAVGLVIDWLMEYLKDWRWKTIEACFTYHAKAMEMGKAASALEDPKVVKERGLLLNQGISARLQGEDLLKEIQIDYMPLDTIMELENKQKITKRLSGMASWEEALRMKS